MMRGARGRVAGAAREWVDAPMRFCVAHLLLVGLVVALVAGPVLAAPPQLRTTLTRAQTLNLTALTRVQVAQEFEAALKAKNVPPDRRDEAMGKFRELPVELQTSLLLTIDEGYAFAANRESIAAIAINEAMLARIRAFLAFRISSFWPDQGSPGSWAYAFGNGWSEDCVVYFDGSAVASHYLDMDFEFFPNSMAFEVPAGASRGVEHDVFVRNTATGNDTGVAKYEIVAPRGYRGYHGWKFSNFGNPSIPWHLYSHYFGASNVEYGDGTHRPAAQQWYDDAYSGAGGGGNCYGMSVSSLRVRNGEFDHMFHAGHFTAPGTAQAWLWRYDWNTTTRETVQQQQGAWYTQEVLDTHTNLYNTQDARAVFNRCQTLCAQVVNRPVLVVWGTGWGHAVVPYDTAVAGNTRRIIVYDNNNPYRETETGAVDPNEATVDWSGNIFTFGSAPKGVAMSYEECTPNNPHLPGAEYGGPGAQAAVVVVSDETEVRQITDEQGNRFFNADGSVNEDPNTRIPFSMRMFPLVQVERGPTLRLPRTPTVIGMRQLLAPPGPTLFVFSQPEGKSLTFDIAGDGDKLCSFYQAGRVLSMQARGAGQIQIGNIGLLPTLEIMNPAELSPHSLKSIRSRPGGDRVFEMRDLRDLGAQPLRVVPSEDGRTLDIQATPGARFNLDVQGPTGRGIHAASYANVLLEVGGGMTLSPANWGQLSQTQLRLQLRNVQTNQLLRQINIDPLR